MMKQREFKIALVLLLALALCAIPASAGSAGRSLPSSVSTDQEFQVTIKVSDYGAAGQVLEKIPEGFTFVSSSLPEKAVSVSGSKISFLLMNEKSFSYTLKAPASVGTYTFNGILRDINKNEFPVLPATSSIKVNTPSNGGGSGGSSKSSSSGGGAGGSPEPQSNVEAKEISQAFVTEGKHVTFEFPMNATCVKYVGFDAKKTLGKISTVVEMLKGQSKLVSSLPEGTIYKNVNIWVGSGGIANSDNIENAVVGFSVEKAWLERNVVDTSSLALWHYDKAWSKLETQKVDENDNYIYFEAKTQPEFGHYVIVASKEKEPSSSIEIKPEASEDSKSNLSSETEKPSKGFWESLPGFEFTVTLGILGAVHCILRRKI